MAVDFFISRAGKDAQWAQWIAQVLDEAGYSVILQDWDFRPGNDFIVRMDDAMRSAERTIAVLSRHYDVALFTVPEWTHAVAQDPTGRQSRLVPVRIDDIVPEGIFKTRVFIDLHGALADEKEARRRLLQGLARGRQKGAPVAFPGATVAARFPGALPPVWRVPSARNPVFVGREHELGEIGRHFAAAEPPPHVVALVGLGGVGKTAIAVEHAHRQRDYYKVVWWVRGERRETVAADLALLAVALEQAGEGDDVGAQVEAARRWLANHDRWLLIVDDAADAAAVRQALPAGGGGHVVLTSRLTSWRRTAAVVGVPPLQQDTGAELVARRSGLPGLPGDGALGQLSRVLGGLPVALELAGAFLEQQGLTATEYLQRLRRRGGLPFDDPAYQPPDYQQPLSAVWRESFNLVQAESAAAGDLLRFAAHLAPDDVPRPALTLGASRLPAGLALVAADVDRLADLVARPRALSLVSTADDGFSMHRVFQAILRAALPEADARRWAADAIAWAEYVLPTQVEDHRLWHRTGRLIGHALAAAEHGCELAVEGPRTVKLLDRGATYLAAAGADTQDVADARGKALDLARRLPDGPPAWLLNNQAVWLVAQQDDAAAEPLLRQAVDATLRSEGGNSPTLGVHCANLGALLHRKGDLAGARGLLLRAVSVLDRHRVTEKSATAHSRLGQVMFELGDKDGAASQFAEAVRGYDATLGPGSLDGITARSFLAQARGEDPSRIVVQYQLTAAALQAEEGRLLASEAAWRGEAEQLLRTALAQGQPGAAVELAALLRASGSEAEGDEVMARAAAEGDAQALYWHSRELCEQGNPAALDCVRRSIAAGNVFSHYDLGLLLAGDPTGWQDAEAAFRRTLDGGYDIALNDLGLLLCEWPGREAEGEALLQRAGQRGQSRAWANLAQYLRQRQRLTEAVDALRMAAAGGYLMAHGRLAYLLEDLGQLDEALQAFRAGVQAGDEALRPHLQQFMARHPGLAG